MKGNSVKGFDERADVAEKRLVDFLNNWIAKRDNGSGKTQGLTAILLKMNNPDTGSFVFILCKRPKARMYEQGTKKALTVEKAFMY